MKSIITYLGVLLILVGSFILIAPQTLYDLVYGGLDSSSFYYTAIVGRLVFGVLLVLAAAESKFPILIKIIGFAAVFAAASFVFIGADAFQEFIASMMHAFKPYARLGGLFSLGFGAFLIYAFSRKES